LIHQLTGGKALPPEILERIVERTDGIPLFIEELTKTLLEGDLLREEDGRYALARPVPSLAIPSSLQDSLMARLDRLAPVKEVAQIGAAIGREFSYDLLAAVARRPEDQLRDALDQLVGAGLVFRRGVLPQASFVFKHALVQDAAYSALLRGRRQELHAAIATALEQQSASHSDQEASAGGRAGLLAHHWLRSENWEKALGYSLEAADRARQLYARPEAISHYWQVLDLLERLPHTPEQKPGSRRRRCVAPPAAGGDERGRSKIADVTARRQRPGGCGFRWAGVDNSMAGGAQRRTLGGGGSDRGRHHARRRSGGSPSRGFRQ
jgi:predicted ATPase